MKTKSFAAQYVFTNTSKPIKNGVVTINEETKEIIDIKQLTKEKANTQFFNGIIIPSFVNAPCHLELSHLKNKVQKAQYIVDFVLEMINLGNQPFEEDKAALWDKIMYEEGISLVGDICNTADTKNVKKNSKISYINFIELIGSTKERYLKNIALFNNIKQQFLSCAIKPENIIACPHAPYTVGNQLFEIINSLNENNKNVITIHNQETIEENLLYLCHNGRFVKEFPINLEEFPLTKKTSLQSMDILSKGGYKNTLLVHNIYSNNEDLTFAVKNFNNPFFAVCPRSNLRLEKKIIDVNSLISKGLTVCIGTDSLSSNDSLSMIEELKVLRQKFPNITLEDLVKMSTLNGAKALNQVSKFGTLKIGSKSGLVLIENIDFQEFNISKDSVSRRLV